MANPRGEECRMIRLLRSMEATKVRRFKLRSNAVKSVVDYAPQTRPPRL
jgi:hypothetical protein